MMLRNLARVGAQAGKVALRGNVRMSSSAATKWTGAVETEEWALFPRQREGNIYDHNWSLCEDGVVPEGDAYRNARLPILTSAVGAKAQGGKIELKAPSYTGKYSVAESGDHMPHEIFSEVFSAQQQLLSSGVNLYVEDAVLGGFSQSRNGVRITSAVPAVNLIFRTLLIPSPPSEVNHRARFKGWNFDPRWQSPTPIWNGTGYDLPKDLPRVAKPGQRPIVAFVGGDHDALAVQFVEVNNEIVGANIVIGQHVPVRGIVDAIGHAGVVLANAQHPAVLALPCTALTKGSQTAVILGGDDSIVEAAAQAGSLFGAYHNILSLEGVSPLWNGYIGAADKATATNLATQVVPAVVVDGKAAIAVNPNNLAHPAKHIVFYEKGATKSKLSADEALKRIVALTGEEAKSAAITALLQNTSVSIIGSASDVNSIF